MRNVLLRFVLVLFTLGATGCGKGSTDSTSLEGAGSGTNLGVSTEQSPPISSVRPQVAAPEGMVWIPGGEFWMGSDASHRPRREEDARPDESPVHKVRVSAFWMDATEVTNAEFAKFVEATGYVTTAERVPDVQQLMKQLPVGAEPPDAEKLQPGSVVFRPPSGPVPTEDISVWWKWTAGANWRHPEGPDSSLEGRENHPVVQVSWDDANAYCDWAKKRLPTEAEWEFAAHGGLDRKPYVWGDEPSSDEHPQANIWQGQFPNRNTERDGFARTAPVKSFPANGYGLFDVAGNVWEWCHDWYRPDAYLKYANIVAVDPQGPDASYWPENPREPRRVMRGGSFLCHRDYCASYRPSARMSSSPDTGTSHLGFRCVISVKDWTGPEPGQD